MTTRANGARRVLALVGENGLQRFEVIDETGIQPLEAEGINLGRMQREVMDNQIQSDPDGRRAAEIALNVTAQFRPQFEDITRRMLVFCRLLA